MTSKGAKLNERVWRLFEDADFETMPNSFNPSEETVVLSRGKKRTVDLSAKALGIKVIGENKSGKDLRESLTVHIHDYKELMNKANADSVLFVSTQKEIAEDDRNYAREYGMIVWGEQELRYYEALRDAIGEYAKYEIIHSFGLKTNEEKNIHNVLALRLHQPRSDSPSELYLFTITPEKLLKTCAIYRRAQGSGEAYQRMVIKRRLRSVRKFVTQDNALLPNVILHLNEKVKWQHVDIPESIALTRENDYELGVLSIPMEYASLELIDGQHRLYGFVDTEPATKENFNLVVLGMAGLSLDRRRDTFVAINDNSRRVDPNLVAYLKYTDDEAECQRNPELMAIKLVVELNKTPPFKGRIRLLDIGEQKITLKGFSGYDLRGLLGPRGLLRKHYMNNSASYLGALRLYFGLLKSLFEDEYQHPEEYIIFTNRGVSAFLKLLKSILKTHNRPLDEAVVKKYLLALKKNWKETWETSQLKNSYAGAKGWKDFHRDLVSAIRKSYPGFKE